MTEYNIFCYAKEYNNEDSFQQKRYRVFNKKVGKNRYYEIRSEIDKIFKDLELNKNDWTDGWKKVTNKQWKELSEIPEFDKDIVESMIGFKLDLEDGKVTIKISKESLKALKDSGIEVVE